MAAQTPEQRLERLKVLRDSWLTAWEASITAAASGIKPDYSIDGQSVSWQSVYTNAMKIIDELDKLIARLSWSIGGTVEHYRVP